MLILRVDQSCRILTDKVEGVTHLFETTISTMAEDNQSIEEIKGEGWGSGDSDYPLSFE